MKTKRAIFAAVYQFRCVPTGHVYIGASIDTLQRKSSHLSMLRGGIHTCPKFQELYDAHGEDAFEWSVVERVAGGGIGMRLRVAELKHLSAVRDSTPDLLIGKHSVPYLVKGQNLRGVRELMTKFQHYCWINGLSVADSLGEAIDSFIRSREGAKK